MAKTGKTDRRTSVALTRETAAALSTAASRVSAPSVTELLRVAALKPESIMRAYVLGVRAEAEERVKTFEKWAARQGSGSASAESGPAPASESGPAPAGEGGQAPAGGSWVGAAVVVGSIVGSRVPGVGSVAAAGGRVRYAAGAA